MNGAYYIGATGMRAQQTGLETIANNVANINTNTYQRSEVRFSELVSQTRVQADTVPVDTSFPDILTGVQARTSARVFEQGNLRQTGKPFDLAISGDGFVEVLGPGGQTWLWRGGTLQINAEGALQTDSGLVLKALIDVPINSSSITIARDGAVSSVSSGSAGCECHLAHSAGSAPRFGGAAFGLRSFSCGPQSQRPSTAWPFGS